MTPSSRATALLAAAGVGVLVEIVACGGSTGREGLPITSADATSEMGASNPMAEAGLDADATVADPSVTGDTAGNPTFDATIEYADAARLPDVSAPKEAAAGVEAGPPPAWTTWSVCACEYVDLTKFVAGSGSTLLDSGAIVMDDAGGCRTQVWTRSQACDDCIRNSGGADFTNVVGTGALFPPCCDLPRDGGGASAGPAKGNGKPQFQLCAELFECLFATPYTLSLQAYCGVGISTADCEKGAGNGPCKAQVEAAFETTSAQDIVNNDWNQLTEGKVGSEGSEVSYLYNFVINNCSAECLPPASSNTGDASTDGQ